MKTLRAAKFLVTGPLILGLLIVINWITSPGHWWVQWAALGIGIVWVISLIRVLGALVLVGGLATVFSYCLKRQSVLTKSSVAQRSFTGATAGRPHRADIII